MQSEGVPKLALFRRIRDYAEEYRKRNEKARREGFRSYGQKRYQQEAPKREAKRREREGVRVPSDRQRLEREAVRNYRRQFGTHARISTVQKGMRWLTPDELRDVASASRGKLRRYGRREPYVPVRGIVINPYWYH